MLRRLTTALAAVTLVAAAPGVALACGGFFCDAATLAPIFQAGERVLFAQQGDQVTMHIEITYTGESSNFGWILPVVEPPKDAAGDPLPLDRAVAVSSQALFPMLQQRTDPVFRVVQGPDYPTDCDDSGGGVGCASGDALSAEAGGGSTLGGNGGGPGGGPTPPVTVLDEAKVGPYDAQLITATSSDALYDWLNTNGYVQDPAARPLLGHYVQLGYAFIGIRLAKGKETGDIRPIALTLGENAPCVPLRLTGIAATPEMPILVWVLGPGRAVPKNFLHAVVDHRALEYFGQSNYIDVVSQAIDTASGHAWVTEFAGAAAPFAGQLLPNADAVDLASLRQAATLSAVLAAFDATGASRDLDWRSVVEDEVHQPATLSVDADTFYTNLDEYAERADVTELVDVPLLADRLADEVLQPLIDLEDLLSSSQTLTRFFTTSDPEEMTKDPIFAFNPALEDVSNDHPLLLRTFTNDDCETFRIAHYGDGTRYTLEGFGGSTVVPGAPALRFVEVLDETGPPVRFNPLQAVEVDTLLDSAVIGTPSLPASFEPQPAEEAAGFVNPPPGWGGQGGCGGGLSPRAALWLGLGAAFAVWITRRRRRAAR